MGGIAAIGGINAALASDAVQAQYQVAVLKKQMDLMQQLGDMAVQLIRSSGTGDPDVGKNLNVTA